MIRDLILVAAVGITLGYLYETGGPERVGLFLVVVSAAVLIAAAAYRAADRTVARHLRAANHTTTEGTPR